MGHFNIKIGPELERENKFTVTVKISSCCLRGNAGLID